MKNNSFKNLGLILALGATTQLWAAESDDSTKNEFRIGPTFGFNITAKFRGFQPAPLATSPGAGPLVNRDYPDGYVHVDSSDNAGNQTWNWGYRNDSQYNAEASTLNFHRLSVNSESGPAASGDPSYGFEVSYLRRLGDCGAGHFSLEFAFGYNRLAISDNSAHSVGATVTTDSFPLGGVIPPFAAYAGSFSSPGALLGAQPTRESSGASGLLTGRRETEADIYNFRLGPVYTLPLSQKVRMELATGLAVAVVNNQFSFSETLLVNGHSEWRSGNGGATDTICGPYIRGGFSLDLSPAWSVFAGAQYQYMVDVIKQSAAGKTVELDFRQAIYVSASVNLRF